MKIQCDVCNKDEASVFCTADEAALCHHCDHRVHHANKLASKHQRFSLLTPSQKQYPLCDICQERRAFMFCKEDRAILCKECDLPIHSANEHTKKHNRFFLTGVKLSADAKIYSSTTSSSSSTPSSTVLTSDCGSNSMSNSKSQSSYSNKLSNPPLISKTAPSVAAATPPIGGSLVGGGSTSTSSISEYLIETLPGWQVEDFLDSSSVPFGGFSKSDDMLPVFDAEGKMVSFSMENTGIWVPQAPPPLYSSFSSQMDCQIRQGEIKDATNNIKGNNRSRMRDDNFIVPQISPNSNFKRSRFLW